MTAAITGEVTTMPRALGQSEYAAGGLRLPGLVGPTHEDDAFAVGERCLHIEDSADGTPPMVTTLVEVPGL